jgi:hypothetical protein
VAVHPPSSHFFIGINDVLSPGFTPEIFMLYGSWETVPPHGRNEGRASVARGEILFDSKPITIGGVNGLNLFASDPLGATSIVGTCGTCHDSPNVGNHSKKLPINIGIADATPPVLDVSGLPVFTVKCTETTGPLAGEQFVVTDLGKALISGDSWCRVDCSFRLWPAKRFFKLRHYPSMTTYGDSSRRRS